ncbi:helix-turn-helix transcriptional regulator [Salinimicrobium sp. HB62]|uniref:helix-turn-helix transcriptional regulator n=1 Tax=Salinimicrobium sp. HB62 TaxID=3077781 RepID=UPI002D799AF5|nr:helix-turn-helix transcriptional regulator [Salinimicrobium sp. HB62]
MKNNIKDLRTKFNLTQAQLADKLYVSRQTVNAIEKGKFDPSLPLAFKISQLFQKPIEEIFEWEEENI